jgi:thioesterase domain-containing protein
MKLQAGMVPSQPQDVERVLSYSVQNYRPQQYDGRALLFQRTERPTGSYRDPHFGWGKVIDKLQVCEVPGDHMTMFLDPHVKILGEKLGASLHDASEKGIAVASGMN